MNLVTTHKDDALLTIGELSELTGVSTSTLRSWEDRVSFPVPVRTSGGQRRYRRSDAALVTGVLAGRDRGLSLAAAVAGVRRQDEVGAGSLFSGLRRTFPHLDVLRVGFGVMRSLTSAIEDECLAHASRPLLFGGFQKERDFVKSGHRWRELSRAASAAVVISDFPHTDPASTPQKVGLPGDHPLLNEWSLVCHDLELSVALVGWEVPRMVGHDGERRFEAILSLEPDVVHHAAVFFADTAVEHGLLDAKAMLGEASATLVEDPRRSAALLRRFATYADR